MVRLKLKSTLFIAGIKPPLIIIYCNEQLTETDSIYKKVIWRYFSKSKIKATSVTIKFLYINYSNFLLEIYMTWNLLLINNFFDLIQFFWKICLTNFWQIFVIALIKTRCFTKTESMLIKAINVETHTNRFKTDFMYASSHFFILVLYLLKCISWVKEEFPDLLNCFTNHWLNDTASLFFSAELVIKRNELMS